MSYICHVLRMHGRDRYNEYRDTVTHEYICQVGFGKCILPFETQWPVN